MESEISERHMCGLIGPLFLYRSNRDLVQLWNNVMPFFKERPELTFILRGWRQFITQSQLNQFDHLFGENFKTI